MAKKMVLRLTVQAVSFIRTNSLSLGSSRRVVDWTTVPRRFSGTSLNMDSKSVDSMLKGYDEIQAKLMEEECILINENDVNVGAASKKVCHLWTNIEKGMLHRAFSVFLFNTSGELLLQQRALSKITYPDHWTNTCCSHPLNFDAELEENNALGVLRAAQRKLNHELGIAPEEVPLDSMHYLTRIHYKSANVPHDGTWGEHEIDYIVFAQRNVTLHPNDSEVKNVQYVTKEKLQHLIDNSKKNGTLITPWFKLIADNFLPKWWNHLSDLRSCEDHQTIHRL